MRYAWLLAAASSVSMCAPLWAGEPAQTAKPWTRWWWPGSALDPAGITAQLEAFAVAGLGGVEITPIYGARGAQARDVDYLSPRWVALLEHTTREAARLNLGVDMATGTGWPFGGPGVSGAQGSQSLGLRDGVLAGKPTAMQVKRAAPGGAGLVLDPYSPDALDAYLSRFTSALATLARGAVRAQFHDSFEYYDASWSPDLPQVFAQLNGYDIQTYARELTGGKPMDADALSRLKGDYRRTLAQMHLDYVNEWVNWAHARGSLARNQAHGAPGNLLDLYAAADIPETESFGMTALPIAGARVDSTGASLDPDPPFNLIGRFASSAAHVAGRKLVSSESLTWLRENFHETPAAAKPQLDRLFLAGINHVFYHGITYSPPDAPWPGWFFYAASQLSPHNPLWRDFSAMNAYVARIQSVLQAGVPDNDVLLYFPFDELADDANGLMRQYGMHENGWLVASAFGRAAIALIQSGYTVDFISDAQLAQLRVEQGSIVAPGGRYRAIAVPGLKRMSVTTLERLLALQRSGATLLFESLPQDVPGLGDLEQRRAQLKTLLADVTRPAAGGGDLVAALSAQGVRREGAPALGLNFVRRARIDGFDYLFVNQSANDFDGWLPLATPAASALLLDPATGATGGAALRRAKVASVYLQIGSGETRLLRTMTRAKTPSVAWRYVTADFPAVDLAGPWQIAFIAGGPELPAAATLETLHSWTELPAETVKSFSGTARYRLSFDAPAGRTGPWLLDLGDVRDAARVRLNGRDLPGAWSAPYRVRIAALRARGNELQIEATNLPANRIRDLDVRKVDWKMMKDINLASIQYKNLDAAGWTIEPAGLLGPVKLVPIRRIDPR